MGRRIMIGRTSKEMDNGYRRDKERRLRFKRDEGIKTKTPCSESASELY
jgi:hypothetical protein